MDSMDPQQLRELAAAYALDALEPDEARQLEALLESSPELRREVAEYRAVAALLSEASEGAPNPSVWARVQSRLDAERSATLPAPPVTKRRVGHVGVAWAAAVAGVVVAGALALRTQSLFEELAEQRAALSTAAAQLAARDNLLGELLNANTVTFSLGSTDEPAPRMQAFWNRDSNFWIFQAFDLTPAGAGLAYQLWFIRDGQPVPSVLFNTAPDGRALITATGPPETTGITHAAVTVEPAGGSLQPTTTPILVGPVGTD